MNLKEIQDNVDVTDSGCWVWKKSCNSAGYGQITVNKKYWLLHRYVYQLNGHLMENLVVRHMCHNTSCCNPDHLKVGTRKDNWHDSKSRHLEAAKAKRKEWSVLGVSYGTIKAASIKTGISQGALLKHTKDGVFQVDRYREACKKANVTPKV